MKVIKIVLLTPLALSLMMLTFLILSCFTFSVKSHPDKTCLTCKDKRNPSMLKDYDTCIEFNQASGYILRMKSWNIECKRK